MKLIVAAHIYHCLGYQKLSGVDAEPEKGEGEDAVDLKHLKCKPPNTFC